MSTQLIPSRCQIVATVQTKSIRPPLLHAWNGWRGTNTWHSSPASKLAHQKQQREAAKKFLALIRCSATLWLWLPSLSFSKIQFLTSPLHSSPFFPGIWQCEEIMCSGVKFENIHITTGSSLQSVDPILMGSPVRWCPVLVGCRTMGRAFYHGTLSGRFIAHSSPSYLHINTPGRALIYIQPTVKAPVCQLSANAFFCHSAFIHFFLTHRCTSTSHFYQILKPNFELYTI